MARAKDKDGTGNLRSEQGNVRVYAGAIGFIPSGCVGTSNSHHQDKER
jgi:hypothetical protein